VHLGDIAELENAPSQALITRVNRETVIHLVRTCTGLCALDTCKPTFSKRVKATALAEHRADRRGGRRHPAEPGANRQRLGYALILSILLVYLLMVALYDAYRAPFVIMFAVPVARSAPSGPRADAPKLNLYSLIGVVMLVGSSARTAFCSSTWRVIGVAAARQGGGDQGIRARTFPPDRDDDRLDDRRYDAVALAPIGLGCETLAWN